MFRRHRTNEREKVKPEKKKVEAPSQPSLGNGDGALWYKKPATNTPRRAPPPQSAPPSQPYNPNVPTPQRTARQTTVDSRHPPPRRHQSPAPGESNHYPKPSRDAGGPPPSSSSPDSHQSNRKLANESSNATSQNNRRPSGSSLTMQQNRIISGADGLTTVDATSDFFSVLLRGDDWKTAGQIVDQDITCVRQKHPVTILGQKTAAYPLHVTVCLNPPFPFFEKVLSKYPYALQIADDHSGRLPLHWACIASAPSYIIQKLVDMYPNACKTFDKSHGRIPLHYLSMHATSVSQINALLEVDSGAIRQKDKQSKTPLDLAQESSNPLKLDIISQLVQRRKTQNKRRSSSSKKQEESKQPSPDDWETPLNVKVNLPPGPEDYQVSDFKKAHYHHQQQPMEQRYSPIKVKGSLPIASPYPNADFGMSKISSSRTMKSLPSDLPVQPGQTETDSWETNSYHVPPAHGQHLNQHSQHSQGGQLRNPAKGEYMTDVAKMAPPATSHMMIPLPSDLSFQPGHMESNSYYAPPVHGQNLNQHRQDGQLRNPAKGEYVTNVAKPPPPATSHMRPLPSDLPFQPGQMESNSYYAPPVHGQHLNQHSQHSQGSQLRNPAKGEYVTNGAKMPPPATSHMRLLPSDLPFQPGQMESNSYYAPPVHGQHLNQHSQHSQHSQGGQLRNPAKGEYVTNEAKTPPSAHRRMVPKPPNSGGFFLDKTVLKARVLKARAKREGGVSKGGSVEDPGPQTTTKNAEIAGHPPPNLGRFETRSDPNNIHNQGNIQNVQDPINSLGYGLDTSVDFMGRAVDTKPPPRRAKKPPIASLKKSPPPNKKPPPPPVRGGDQATQQQQQQHGFNNTHHMPKQPPPPPLEQWAPPRKAPPPPPILRTLDHQPQQAALKKPPPPPPIVHSSKPPNAHSLMLHSRPDEVKVAAKSKGQDLMDKMNLTIRGLSETVARQRRDWQDKDSQLSGVDAQLGQMDVAEAAITNEWEQAQASHHDHRDLLAQRRERVAHLVQEIARLQDELQQENAGLDSIERAMLVYKDTARRTEHQLQVHRDEQGDLGAIRQALEEEKAIVGRDMINNESELKSLEAIQNLAIHE